MPDLYSYLFRNAQVIAPIGSHQDHRSNKQLVRLRTPAMKRKHLFNRNVCLSSGPLNTSLLSRTHAHARAHTVRCLAYTSQQTAQSRLERGDLCCHSGGCGAGMQITKSDCPSPEPTDPPEARTARGRNLEFQSQEQ